MKRNSHWGKKNQEKKVMWKPRKYRVSVAKVINRMNEALQTVPVFIYTQIEFPTSLMMILVMSSRGTGEK